MTYACCTAGSTFLASAANPLLYQVIYSAAKMVCKSSTCEVYWLIPISSAQVKCSNPAFDTVYDEWLHYKSAVFNGT